MTPDLLLDRRDLLRLAVATAATAALTSTGRAEVAPSRSTQAVAFDALAIFDPAPVRALAETLFPGHGAALAELWRTRQFEYCWLRTLAGRYADFRTVTEESLGFAAAALKLPLSGEARNRLMQATLELNAYPDVAPALDALRGAGIRLVFLSNFTERMLETNLAGAGLGDRFEALLSTDRVQAYKPDPRAYRMAVDALGLPREAIVFAAFAGWDAAGAKAFGYPTFWVNRRNQPLEALGVAPDAMGETVADLARFALRA